MGVLQYLPSGTFFTHTAALVQKNLRLRRRAWKSALFELIVPIAVGLLLRWLGTLSQTVYTPPQLNRGSFTIVAPYTVPASINPSYQRIAVVGSNTDFLPLLDTLYPSIEIPPFGVYPAVTIPKFSDLLMFFPSNDALNSYIQSSSYGNANTTLIYAAYYFQSSSLNSSTLKYTLRMNSSDTFDTSQPPITYIDNSYSYYPSDYFTSSYPLPSFATLTMLMDRILINSPGDPPSPLEWQSFAYSFVNVLVSAPNSNLSRSYLYDYLDLQTTNISLFMQINDIIGSYVALGESYSPQSLIFQPFPVPATRSNDFYDLILPNMSILFVIMFVIVVASFTQLLAQEKVLNLVEGLMLMGISPMAHIMSWMIVFIASLSLISLIFCIIAVCTFLTGSSFILLFLYFFVFSIFSASAGLLVTTFIKEPKLAAVVVRLGFLALYFPYYGVRSSYKSSVKMGASMAGPTGFTLGLDVIWALESAGTSLSSSTAGTVINGFSYNRGVLMMCVCSLTFLLLAWIIESRILVALFRSLRRFYYRNKRAQSESSYNEVFLPADNATDSRYFEEYSGKMDPNSGLWVKNVSREFRDTTGRRFLAVNNASLRMQEGQIFVLLGHNGAGKSTLISMMSGQLEASAGSVSVYGYDISTEFAAAHRLMGVCPQHDVLWPELTVREHLQLFLRVKGVPLADVPREVESAVQEVGLTEKLDAKTADLSGGQKRKLSVAIAFSGGSKVIFLDEPTSGVDIYSRRSMWSLLQQSKEGRVIVLTTHFMDEADVLGDRIAIMANGQVECDGSPHFLKNAYGIGYVLSVTRASGSPVDPIFNYVKKSIPQAVLGSHVGGETQIRLPFESAPLFPPLLRGLKENSAALGVQAFGIAVCDIQDVFLKVAEGAHYTVETEEELAQQAADASASATSAVSNPLSRVVLSPSKTESSKLLNPSSAANYSGSSSLVANNSSNANTSVESGSNFAIMVLWNQVQGLFKKRLAIMRRDPRVILQSLIMPILVILIGMIISNVMILRTYPPFTIDGSLLNPTFPRDQSNPMLWSSVVVDDLFPNNLTDHPTMRDFVDNVPHAFFPADLHVGADNISSYYSGFSSQSYTRFITAMQNFTMETMSSMAQSRYGYAVFSTPDYFYNPAPMNYPLTNGSSASLTIGFNYTYYHSPMYMASLASSALLSQRTGVPSTITYVNEPLPMTQYELSQGQQAISVTSANTIMMSLSLLPATALFVIVREKQAGFRTQQRLAGMTHLSFWVATLLFDFLAYIVPMIGTIIMFYAFDLRVFTTSYNNAIGAMVLLLLFFGVAGTSQAYVVAPLFKSPTVAQGFIMIMNLVMLVLTTVSLVSTFIRGSCSWIVSFRGFFRLFPAFAFGEGIMAVAMLGPSPTMYSTCLPAMSAAAQEDILLHGHPNALGIYAAGPHVIYLACTAIGYFILAVVVDKLSGVLAVREFFARFDIGAIRHGKKPSESTPVGDWDTASAAAAARLNSGSYNATPTNNSSVVMPTSYNDEINDPDVEAEIRRIDALPTPRRGSPSGRFEDYLIFKHLRKTFYNSKKPKHAVRDLSFSVSRGECFALLGVNGAGKSTSLAMLIGDVLPSGGAIYLDSQSVIRNENNVLGSIGYCPQQDAISDFLTIREHLSLFAHLRNVLPSVRQQTVDRFVRMFEMDKYADRPARVLSGGQKRMLCLSLAFMGFPKLVVLDEMSTGMGAVEKRRVWKVISRLLSAPNAPAVVLTTHSLEEVEALCPRLGIMVGGRLRCIGSPQHLKQTHSKGYSVQLRLSEPPEEATGRLWKRLKSDENLQHLFTTPSSRSSLINPLSAMESGSVADDASSLSLTRLQIDAICNAFDKPTRSNAINAHGTGWKLALSIAETGSTSALDFCSWWVEEDCRDAALEYMQKSFSGVELREKQNLLLSFHVPQGNFDIADIFEIVENSKKYISTATYSVSQTTLEQIFSYFASKQEEETIIPRGIA